MPSGSDAQSDASRQTINIDQNGNLVLVVGSDDRVESVDGVHGVGSVSGVASFRIHSENLCQASSVFRNMLMGSFQESGRHTKSEQWTVELPEDDPTAFGILLMIIHVRFDKVPFVIDVRALYDITVLTDKYDMTATLRPWASTWLSSINRQQDERLIWIAWELGDLALFEHEATRLLNNFCLDDNNNIMVWNRQIYAEKYLDSIGLLSKLRSHRSEQLDRCLQKLSGVYQTLLNGDTGLCNKMNHSYMPSEDCFASASTQLGYLVRALVKADLFPLPASAEDMALSLCQLQQAFRAFKICAFPGHVDCDRSAEIRRIGASILAQEFQCSRHSYKEHMDIQARKTGLIQGGYAVYADLSHILSA